MRAAARVSSVILVHEAPASSDRYRPVRWPVATAEKIRLGRLGAIAKFTCVTPWGRPLVSGFQVVPPSIDLNIPPFVPDHAPFSHGPWRDSHSPA